MNNFFRTIIAAYGAKKLGGGCFSTILVFIIIYYLLGQCNRPARSGNTYNHPAAGHVTYIYEGRRHHADDLTCYRFRYLDEFARERA